MLRIRFHAYSQYFLSFLKSHITQLEIFGGFLLTQLDLLKLVTMHFSKTVLIVLAGTANVSSYLLKFNSTELGAVRAGVEPVIIKSITITEHLAVIPMRTPRYKWLNQPIRLTPVPTSSKISEEQIKRRDPIRIDYLLITFLPPATTVLDGTTLVRLHKHRSIPFASEAAIPQQINTTELPRVKVELKTLNAKVRADMIAAWFKLVKKTFQTLVSQQTATSELPKTAEGVESMLQNRSVDWMSGLEITAAIQTITPTWSVSYKKWHGPYSPPKATAVVSGPVEEQSAVAMGVTTEEVPVITASAFMA